MTTKPTPLYPEPPRAVCPHCGQTSYSTSGVHPQCAMHSADRLRMDRLKLLKPKVAPPVTAQLRPHEKRCPQCHVAQHVRKSRCQCGFTFLVAARRSSGE